MPNVPPDGWESAMKAARADVDVARAEVAELRSMVAGGPGGLPRQLQELRAGLDELEARVATLEGGAAAAVEGPA